MLVLRLYLKKFQLFPVARPTHFLEKIEFFAQHTSFIPVSCLVSTKQEFFGCGLINIFQMPMYARIFRKSVERGAGTIFFFLGGGTHSQEGRGTI